MRLTEVKYRTPLRFFPNYKMIGKDPTEVKKVYELAEVARKKLSYVYEGNC